MATSRRSKHNRTGKTGEKTGKNTGVMVSPRNGVECPTGAHEGNTGGKPGRSGRPPTAIREALRVSFDQRIKVLEEIADGREHDAGNRIRAVDTLGKYGLPAQKEIVNLDDVRARVHRMIELVRAWFPEAQQQEQRLAQLKEIWR